MGFLFVQTTYLFFNQHMQSFVLNLIRNFPHLNYAFHSIITHNGHLKILNPLSFEVVRVEPWLNSYG